jgi:hypothetical protein
MDSRFEQTGGIDLDGAAVGGGLARQRVLNFGCDVNGERHRRSFQAMSPRYPAVPPAVK